MTLLPFTIEAWRSGLQPVTNNDELIDEFTYFRTADTAECFSGTVRNCLCRWRMSQLRLRPKTEKRWVVLVRGQITGDVLANLIIGPVNPEPYTREIARVEIEVPCP